jgi:ribonuclease T2
MRYQIDNAFLALCLVVIISPSARADGLPADGLAPATGQFLAQETCPLYQSKRRKTNPGALQTNPGTTYSVREVIMAGGAPDWVRVHSGASVQEPLRWVASGCGEVSGLAASDQNGPGNGGGRAGDGDCHTADTYDAQVLALSWQPGFCEQVRPNLTECQTQTAERFDATHFALHGLWPNKRGCGHDYGYCGTVSEQPSGNDKCDYPALSLESEVRTALGQIMPSVSAGTCLQRHEYWKHGSCRDADPNAYYRLAIALTSQVNASNLVSDFIQPNIGKTVSRDAFDEAFDQAFGEGAHRHVSTNCRGGFLTEMQIALPPDTPSDARFADLIAAAGTRARGSCGRQFFLDPAGIGRNAGDTP